MKKLLVVITLLLVFTLSSCGGSPLEKALSNMEKVESFRMDITMNNIPFFGTITMYMKYDGDMMSMNEPFTDTEIFVKIVDDKQYLYFEQLDGSYVLSDAPVDTEQEVESDYLSELNAEFFVEDEDGVWVLTEDRIYLDDTETDYMEDVELTINEDGYIETLTFTLVSEGISMDLEIVFSGFNSTEVTLPE